MKVHNVKIENWEVPGKSWWEDVEKRRGEPLIEATISMTMSYDEYFKLVLSPNEDQNP